MAGPRIGILGPATGVTSAAASLIQAFAERHIPLPTSLAQSLLQLRTAPVPALDPVWGRVYVRAGEALELPHVVGRTPFWARSLPAFATLAAEPILRWAAGGVARVGLCGAAPLGPQPSSEDERALSARVETALSDGLAMGRGFWIGVGLGLHAAAQRSLEVTANRRDLDLHETDLPLGRLLFEVEPQFEAERLARRRRERARTRNIRTRTGFKPKEGGTTGIRVSRDPDDLSDAIASDLVLPDVLVASRLLQEGLLVRHRPPQREPKRDLLTFWCCDRRLEDDATLLAKAAWADAGVRLRFLLAQSGLARSDLLWAEAGSVGRSAAHLRVEDLAVYPGLRALDPMRLGGLVRAETLWRANLLPDFVETLPLDMSAHDMADPDPVELTGNLPALAQLALRRMMRSPRVNPVSRPASAPRLDDYARRLAVLCLPGASAEAQAALGDWRAIRARAAALLRRPMGSLDVVAVLVSPPQLDRNAAYWAMSDARGLAKVELKIPEEGDGAEVLARTAGRLSAWMMDITMEAAFA